MARRGEAACGNSLQGLPGRAPGPAFSEALETHMGTGAERRTAVESACSCPLLSCHWLGGDRPGMRKCLHQPFPLRRASKLALLDLVTYLRMYFELNYYACTPPGLSCLSDERACYHKSFLFLPILFWIYSVCDHYSRPSFLLISIRTLPFPSF